ncbi:hypothetical protein [Bartonella sp. HY406]|uniref:hypothetical protein n=1 Tax=Bartonella sp. HY406 TaxID=2979331 RepID=UPI0021C734AE|nr:hypothetical protein [Bartonella sp. HY406]UXN02961.1 hypothetical protein N6B01_10865 [Bartonella sp. HY406]
MSDAIDNNAHTASNPNFSDTEVVLDTVTITADNSTTINGDANADYCFKERGWLCFDIYDLEKETTNETSYANTSLIPEHMRPWVPCKKRWKIVADDKNEDYNYLGRYYEPMQGDCVPTVVFRGTSSEWVDLGLHIKIEINGESLLKENGETVSHLEFLDKDFLDDDDYMKKVIIDESGEFKLPTIDDPRWIWGGNTVPYKIYVVLGAKNGKGWAINVQQAFGEETSHYRAAMSFGHSIASLILNRSTKNSEKVLHFTGHSLGGGLASAAAHAAYFTTQGAVKIMGTTFNASGLHKNTVPKQDIGTVPFFVHTVQDEVLTMLQSHMNNIPFLGAIARMKNITIPEAYGAQTEYKALSPGRVYADLDQRNEFYKPIKRPPPKPKLPSDFIPRADVSFNESLVKFDRFEVPVGKPLPRLFPINKQTFIPNQTFPQVCEVDAMLQNSKDMKDFCTKFTKILYDRYKDAVDYDKLEKTSMWNPIDSREKRNKDMWEQIAELFHKDIKQELKDLLHLMAASGDYHRIDVVAQSVMLRRG